MYKDYLVDIPVGVPGVSRKKLKGITYIYYMYRRDWDPVKKHSVPHSTTIGKCPDPESTQMYPNDNYYWYLPQLVPAQSDLEEKTTDKAVTGAGKVSAASPAVDGAAAGAGKGEGASGQTQDRSVSVSEAHSGLRPGSDSCCSDSHSGFRSDSRSDSVSGSRSDSVSDACSGSGSDSRLDSGMDALVDSSPDTLPVPQHSSVLKVGTFLILREIARKNGMIGLLRECFGSWTDLLLDLTFCSVVFSDWAHGSTQWNYPLYTWQHPLWVSDGHVASLEEVRSLFRAIDRLGEEDPRAGVSAPGEEVCVGRRAFLRRWQELQAAASSSISASVPEGHAAAAITASAAEHRICILLGAAEQRGLSGDLVLAGTESVSAQEEEDDGPAAYYAVAFDAATGVPLGYLPYFSRVITADVLRFLAERVRQNLVSVQLKGPAGASGRAQKDLAGQEKQSGDLSRRLIFIADRGVVSEEALDWAVSAGYEVVLAVNEMHRAAVCPELQESRDLQRGRRRMARESPQEPLQEKTVSIGGRTYRGYVEQIYARGLLLLTSGSRELFSLRELYLSALWLGRLSVGEEICWADPESGEELWIPARSMVFIEFLAMILRGAFARGQRAYMDKGYPILDRHPARSIMRLEWVEICRREDGSYDRDGRTTPDQQKLLKCFGLATKDVGGMLKEMERREKERR